jgi:hypothetical protein
VDAYHHTHGTLLPLNRRWPETILGVSPEKVRWFAAMMQGGQIFPPIRVAFGKDGCFYVQDGESIADCESAPIPSLLARLLMMYVIEASKEIAND